MKFANFATMAGRIADKKIGSRKGAKARRVRAFPARHPRLPKRGVPKIVHIVKKPARFAAMVSQVRGCRTGESRCPDLAESRQSGQSERGPIVDVQELLGRMPGSSIPVGRTFRIAARLHLCREHPPATSHFGDMSLDDHVLDVFVVAERLVSAAFGCF